MEGGISDGQHLAALGKKIQQFLSVPGECKIKRLPLAVPAFHSRSPAYGDPSPWLLHFGKIIIGLVIISGFQMGGCAVVVDGAQ